MDGTPAASLLREAVLHYEAGELPAARDSAEELLRVAESTDDDELFAEGLLLLSNVHCAAADFDEAERFAATCCCFVDEKLKRGHSGAVAARVNRAVILLERYRLRGCALSAVERAGSLLREAEQCAEDAGGVARLALAEALHNTGVCCELLGRYTDALAAYMRSMSIRVRYEDAAGVADLKLALTMEHVAMLFRLMGPERLGDAARLMGAVAAARRRLLGPRHPLFAAAVLAQGVVAGEMGNPRRAAALMRRAVDIRTRIFGPQDPQTMDAQRLLAAMSAE